MQKTVVPNDDLLYLEQTRLHQMRMVFVPSSVNSANSPSVLVKARRMSNNGVSGRMVLKAAVSQKLNVNKS